MSVQDRDFDHLYHTALKELEANSVVGNPQIADLLAKRDLVLADCKDDYLCRHKEAVDRFEEIIRLRVVLAEHAITQQYVDPFDVDDREKFVCKICGTGDALTPGEIEHADGCLLASDSAPAGTTDG